MRSSPAIVLILTSLAALGLTGCTMVDENDPKAQLTTATPVAAAPSIVISGNVHGGMAPVSGAHVYLFAVGTTGYGAASLPALSSQGTGLADANGAYVLTDGVGAFSIPSTAIACSSNQMTYLLVTGGNAGLGANAAISLIAAYGACPTATTVSNVAVNEITTIGTGYALAGFASDALHISSSGSSAAALGVRNAFSVVANLYSASTGVASSVTPSGNGAVPQQTINTLANMLASCVNTGGASSSACRSLFGATSPTQSISDTASAAIAIAHQPAANVATLFALQAMGGVTFQPALAAAPTSLVLPVLYSGGSLDKPYGLAVDAGGNIWVGNGADGIRSAFSTTGTPLSAAGFADGLTRSELSLAVDTAGNVWAADLSASLLSEVSPAGNILTPPSQFTAAGLHSPLGMAFDKAGMLWVGDDSGVTQINPNGQVVRRVAIPSAYDEGAGDIEVDGLGNIWVTNIDNNALVKLSSSGVPAFGVAGVGGGGLMSPEGIAFDAQNNVWVANAYGSSISKFDNNGRPLSPIGFSGGGISANRYIAVDGAGFVWSPSSNNGVISQFDSSGNPMSPTGFLAKPGGAGFWAVAIDGSGNVWSTSVDGALVQLVGAAAPVVTPLATAALNNMLGTRP